MEPNDTGLVEDDTETADAEITEEPETAAAAIEDVDDLDEDSEADGDAAAEIATVPAVATAGAEAPRLAPPLPAQVKARIAECLRERLAALDEELANTRKVVDGDHFFDGLLRVLEQRRRRWSTTLALAEQA